MASSSIKNILIPIDLSETSLNALETAIQMAKRHNASLHLLYTQDITEYYPDLGGMVPVAAMYDEIFKKDKARMEKIVRIIFFNFRMNCHLHIEAGYRSKVISQKAAELNIDLIVIGTAAGINNQLYLNDSLPYTILQQCNCHVLTIPAGKILSAFRKIVLPVLSKGDAILKLAGSRSIIEKNNAAIAVVGMVDKHDLDLVPTVKNLSERVYAKARLFTRSATAKFVYAENISKEISAICHNENAQLVVIDADTKRNLKEFFFGNFTQRMIRNPEVAVLCIKSDRSIKKTAAYLNLPYGRHVQLNY